ncbi:MAG: hypothetical protein LBQ66_05200 [Planctomycetaceae bacterium]|jgi:hypothetical protein|nr:hypothetical protein [Planctomycetaceae bacterium]
MNITKFTFAVLLVAAALTISFTSSAAAAGLEDSLIQKWTAKEGTDGKQTASPEILPKAMKSITITAWIEPKEINGAYVFRKEDGNFRFLLGFQSPYGVPGVKKNWPRFLTFGVRSGNYYYECDSIINHKELLDGKKHFIAGTFDGKWIRVYLDGREIGAYHKEGDFGYDNSPKSGTIHIGNFGWEHLNGKIHECSLYSKAFSADEIEQLFKNSKTDRTNENVALETAKKIYQKGNDMQETLFNFIGKGKQNEEVLTELHRLLQHDFPEDVNNYILSNQSGPFDDAVTTREELIASIKVLEQRAFEYVPLTKMQWDVLSPKEVEKWKAVAAKKEKLANDYDKMSLQELRSVLNEIKEMIQERPRQHEAVATYRVPKTPETKDRTEDETRRILENEWLFQCGGKPTTQNITDEIGNARKLIKRIGENLFTEESKKLDELEKQLQSFDQNANGEQGVKALYFAVRTVKRAIMFKNPVIDFDTIVYNDGPYPEGSESHHETRHRLGYMAVPGGRLIKLKGLNPSGHQEKILPQEPLHGTFWRHDVSFDGKKLLVSFKPHNEKTFHLYEVNADGTGLRQLTAGIFDDLDPIYLPDGKNIIFTTTRGYLYVRCMPPTNAPVIAKMPLDTKPGDKNLYILSRNGEPEYTPSVMADGRIIYTRWEYTDKPLWRCQSLWTMNPDGTLVQTFWGNQSVWPDLLKDARQIPGSQRVMFTGSAHHEWFAGSIGIIDPAVGLNFPDGLVKVTQEVAWPESGNGPVDPKAAEDYQRSRYGAYYSPYPLSETDFLVSANRHGKFVLLLMDINGNREIINEGFYNIFDAQPLRARSVPPMQMDRTDMPTWETRNTPKTGMIYSNNVYENAPQELRNKAKFLRIWSIEHKTYTYWYKRPYISTGPVVSAVQSEGIKKIIGTVPIEEDGSVSFNAPSGVALHFQLLDENQLALQTMKSFTGVMPGETRGCLGCHESHHRSIVQAGTGKAMKRQASDIKPVAWKDITVGYERYVQTVLDKHCAKCHEDPNNKASAKFNTKLRPGPHGFKEPYWTLLGAPAWGGAYHGNQKADNGFGWADTILVEGFDTTDPAGYATYPAMTKLSYKSRLIARMMGEDVIASNGQKLEHPKVNVTGDELLRVILWVDAMGPYIGEEELREIDDPEFQGVDWISQRPRIKTAPIVQRPGPFDPFFTDTDPAYQCPSPELFNALPHGVKR